jgi:tight adherence protein B
MNVWILLTALAFTLAVWVIVFAGLIGYHSWRQGRLLDRRVECYVAPYTSELAEPTLSDRVHAWLADRPQGRRLLELIKEAEVGSDPGKLVLYIGTLALVLFLVGALFLGNLLTAVVLAAGAVAIPYFWLQRRAAQKWRHFLDQLPEALVTISNALSAGASIIQALEQAVQELTPPIQDELRTVVEEVKLGKDLEEALTDLRARVPVPALDSIIASVLIQRRSGGNLAELLSETALLLQEDVRLENEMRVLTAQGQMSARLVGFMPLAMFAFLYFFNRAYLQPLLSTTLGMGLLTLALILEVVGFIMIQRIATIKG